jgi:hypothetical protein
MKKSLQPELNFKWWKKHKPLHLKKTGFGAALKNYEIAADHADHNKMKVALTKVTLVVKVVIGACHKTHDADTIFVLKKYKKIIKDMNAEIDARKLTAAANPSASAAPLKQKIGKNVVIWRRDISQEVLKIYQPTWLTGFTGYKMALTLNADILDVLEKEKDMVTPAFMAQDANDLGEKLIGTLVDRLKRIDREAVKTPANALRFQDSFKPYVKKALVEASVTLKAIPQARWNKFVADKKAYKAYKIKAGGDLAIGILNTTASGIGVGVAAAATVTTGGAAVPGLVLGVVATARAVADLAKQVHSLAIGAETVERVLREDLKTLEDRYTTKAGEASKAQGAIEIGGSTLKGLLSVDAPFLATLPKCDKNYGLWVSKVQHLSVSGRKFSAEIIKGLEACAKLETKLKGSKNAKARKVFDKLGKTRKLLDAALNSCSNTMARVDKAETNMKPLKTILDALQSTNPDYAKIFEKVFPRVIGIALAVGTGGVGIEGAKSSLDMANAVVGLVKDIELEAKAGLEDAIG